MRSYFFSREFHELPLLGAASRRFKKFALIREIRGKRGIMPGPLLNAGSIIMCAHGAPAMPTAPVARVLLSGQPVVTMAAPHTVTGCPFNVSGAPVPCVTANWVLGAVRVKSMGMPVLLMDSQAICIPNGTPVIITFTQPRVIGM